MFWLLSLISDGPGNIKAYLFRAYRVGGGMNQVRLGWEVSAQFKNAFIVVNNHLYVLFYTQIRM